MMTKTSFITLLILFLPTLAWSQMAIGPMQRATWTYQVESVAKSDMETVSTRVGDIVYARLRLSGANDFSLSSREDGLIKITWKVYKSSYEGLKRLISSPMLMTLNASPDITRAENRVELEGKRRPGDYIFRCHSIDPSDRQPTYQLAEGRPLFGTPHIKCVNIEYSQGKAEIELELTPLGLLRLKDHWAKWVDKKMVVIMGGRIHGTPLQFGPLVDGRLRSKPIESKVGKVLEMLMQAGCSLPRLTLQQP